MLNPFISIHIYTQIVSTSSSVSTGGFQSTLLRRLLRFSIVLCHLETGFQSQLTHILLRYIHTKCLREDTNFQSPLTHKLSLISSSRNCYCCATFQSMPTHGLLPEYSKGNYDVLVHFQSMPTHGLLRDRGSKHCRCFLGFSNPRFYADCFVLAITSAWMTPFFQSPLTHRLFPSCTDFTASLIIHFPSTLTHRLFQWISTNMRGDFYSICV